ncbi:DNA primase [Candidatus Magnetomonas plexicatena]|uniref:DNA primase n=1 Tax=Candidatus Magnetomonas plexicatena TaxID=2552947 RepID=UPI001C757AF1|nr:DNA primase [Nitrospirales bacterium LBB_01]
MDLQRVRDDVKSRLDIVDVISKYVNLKRSGANFKGLCPFHNEKTSSFTVSPVRQVFHCFGCGAGGDIFTFVMKEEGLAYLDAVKQLAEQAGIKIDTNFYPQGMGTEGRQEYLNIHAEARDFFQTIFKKSEKAVSYLKARGLTDESLDMFSIGFAPDSKDILYKHLRSLGHLDGKIFETSLVSIRENTPFDVFRRRIMFPIDTAKGETIAFGGRALDDVPPKYLNSSETPLFKKKRTLYGLSQAHAAILKARSVVIVEGYLDVIMCHQYGIRNVVAPLGTALSEEHATALKRSADEVIVLFDGDEAGVRAARRAIALISKKGLIAKGVVIPGENDPDSLLRHDGQPALAGLISQAMGFVEFMLSTGGTGIENLREMYRTIEDVEDTVLRGKLITELSQKGAISETTLRESVKGRTTTQNKETTVRVNKRLIDEEILFNAYMGFEDVRETIAADLELVMFENATLKKIFAGLLDGQLSPTTDSILALCTEEEISYITSLMVQPYVDTENVAQNVSDCLKNMKNKIHQRTIAEINSKIKMAENLKNTETIAPLQAELSRLNRLIKTGKEN